MLRNRYPHADILAQRGHWDDATRDVVLDRVHNVPALRFFNASQRETLQALCERIVPQDHRDVSRQIPIAPWIDDRCRRGVVDGVRFEGMPSNEVAWVWGLGGLDQSAEAAFGRRFAELDGPQQDQVLRSISEGNPVGDAWRRMPARRWWIHTALRQITGVYYAHPYAWNEIGFGGPAYPRGYASLNFGAPEPWEPREAPTEIPEPTQAPGARRAPVQPGGQRPDEPVRRIPTPAPGARSSRRPAPPTAPALPPAPDHDRLAGRSAERGGTTGHGDGGTTQP